MQHKLTWYQHLYDLVRYGPMALHCYIWERRHTIREFLKSDE